MAENRSKSEGFMLRFPDGLRDRVKSDADERGRSMNAEIIWRIENYEKAQQAWASADAQVAKLEEQLSVRDAEIDRLYEERSSLFETMNNQERSLQTLREALATLTIMARSLGEAFQSEGDRAEILRVLAAGLAGIETDISSEPSEPVDQPIWEKYNIPPDLDK
nr:Arc family DNA-binding protein [uncultured Shinella sp.]